MRPAKACAQCRAGKRKCDRNSDSVEPCVQCFKRNILCSMTTAGGVVQQDNAWSPQSVQPLVLAPTSIEMHLVDLYFQYIHNQPHSIFHEHTFKKSFMEGKVSKPVLFGMMGMSARFAEDADIRAQGPVYCSQARVALKKFFDDACMENLQACILVGNNCMGDGDSAAESLYLVLASRMAQLLNLGVVNKADDGVSRELKRRIFWTCFIIDTWASGGSDVMRHFSRPAKQPRLPVDEAAFAALRPGDADITNEDWKPGLWAHMVTMVEIYSRVQDLHRQLVDAPEWDERVIDESVRRLEAEFDQFERSLDPCLHFSLDNLSRFIERGQGSVFIAFHLGYHHYYTLLFYQYLDQRRPYTKNGREYAQKCKLHASTVCDVLKASREMLKASALYNIVGHVTIVSSSVLLHTYLFGEPQDLEDSRQRLESNLATLVQLRRYWPSVEIMINRLVVFQKTCINSMGRNTHRFDKWMVKFLTAHALELEDKATDEPLSQSEQSQLYGYAQLERSRISENLITEIQESSMYY